VFTLYGSRGSGTAAVEAALVVDYPERYSSADAARHWPQ
jgi:hypothetical protein